MARDRASGAVEDCSFPPETVPRKKRATITSDAVVPGIHTPYDFYERIYLDA
jgi:hypothetical protein